MALLGGFDRFMGGVLDSPTMQMGMGLLGAPRGANFGQSLLGASNRAFAQRREVQEEQRRAMEEAINKQQMLLQEQARREQAQRDNAERMRKIAMNQAVSQQIQAANPRLAGMQGDALRRAEGILGRNVAATMAGYGENVPTGLLQGRSPLSSVNINTPGMNYQEKARFDVAADAYKSQIKALDENLAKIAPFKDAMRGIKNLSTNAASGTAAPARLAIAKGMQFFGVPQNVIANLTAVDDIGATEAFQGLSAQASAQVLGVFGQTLGPYSDKDLQRMEAMVGSLLNTPEGNKMIAEYTLYSLERNEAMMRYMRNKAANFETPTPEEQESFMRNWERNNRSDYLGSNWESRMESWESRTLNQTPGASQNTTMGKLQSKYPGQAVEIIEETDRKIRFRLNGTERTLYKKYR